MSTEVERSPDPWPARLRGFGPAGIVAILVIVAAGNVGLKAEG